MLHPGELAALGTALAWTASSFTFALASRRCGGLPVNQFRLAAAVPGLLLLHLCLLGTAWPVGLPWREVAWLAASGVAGLVLGDIGYFHALRVIGPRPASVLMATWPAMATALHLLGGGQGPDAAALAGVLLTMAGVILVLLRARDAAQWNAGVTATARRWAVGGALLGALGQAAGSVIVNQVAARTGLPGLSAALLRLLAASLGILVVMLLRGQPGAWRQVVRDRWALLQALLGTLFGPVLGVWMSMVALAGCEVPVAAALMATTPIFLMPVARVAYGARIGALGVLGTVLAVAGVAVLELA